jgi:hypothetical protein
MGSSSPARAETVDRSSQASLAWVPPINRKALEGGSCDSAPRGGEEEEQSKEGGNSVMPRSLGNATRSPTPTLGPRLGATRGGGDRLPAHTRSFMEARFGVGFGDVRIHTDAEAADMTAGSTPRHSLADATSTSGLGATVPTRRTVGNFSLTS